MKNQSRRDFFKIAGGISAGLVAVNTTSAKAGAKNILSEYRMGTLVDTTVCIGCRQCEYACKKAHDLPSQSLSTYQDRSVYKQKRRPDDTTLTVVNEYENPKNREVPINVKVQCMHCDHPACVSACIVAAFSKEENGSIIWDTGKCIGCRYCMVACPFQIPAFEFHDALSPDIRKCDFCIDRTREGKRPACVDICPVEALTYGERHELVKLAHKKIETSPERYVDHIYGEHEIGGTGWMYLAGREFPDLQFPQLGNKPALGVAESIQHGIFKFFVPPLSFYALLGGVMWITKNREKSK